LSSVTSETWNEYGKPTRVIPLALKVSCSVQVAEVVVVVPLSCVITVPVTVVLNVTGNAQRSVIVDVACEMK